jgi:predicted nucleic acid-binding protein
MAWSLAGQLARGCRDAGLTVPSTDLVVAACARRHRVELEYCDEHFGKVMPLAEKL